MQIKCPHCGEMFDFNVYGGSEGPLRAARREKNMTVKQVALELGISPFTLQELERGKVDPRMSWIRKATALFGKTAEELFPEPDPEQQEMDAELEEEAELDEVSAADGAELYLPKEES